MEKIYSFNKHNKTIFYTTTFMIYTIVSLAFLWPIAFLETRSAKGEIPIKGCIAGHLFVYAPNKDYHARAFM